VNYWVLIARVCTIGNCITNVIFFVHKRNLYLDMCSGGTHVQYRRSHVLLQEDNCALLGCYAASSASSLPTFRDNLSFPSSGVLAAYTAQESVVLIHLAAKTLNHARSVVSYFFFASSIHTYTGLLLKMSGSCVAKYENCSFLDIKPCSLVACYYSSTLKKLAACVTSGFRLVVNEILDLLGCYAA